MYLEKILDNLLAKSGKLRYIAFVVVVVLS